MSKSQENRARSDIRGYLPSLAAGFNTVTDRATPWSDIANARGSELYPSVVSGYGDIQRTGGYDPGILGNLRNTGNIYRDTGGYDYGEYANLQNTLGERQQGIDPSILGDIRSRFSSFSDSGGYTDPDTLTAGYKSLIDTGGISDADAARRVTMASRSGRSAYDTLSDQARRTAAATGGFQGADLSKLARQAGQTAAEASTNAYAGIDKDRQLGRIAGLSGYSGMQGDVARGRLAALQSGGQLELANEAQRLAATRTAADLASNRAAGTRDIYGRQLGLESDVARNSILGTSGLASLYGGQMANANDLLNTALRGQQGSADTTANLLGLLSGLSRTKGPFDNFMDIARLASGTAVGLAGGGK